MKADDNNFQLRPKMPQLKIAPFTAFIGENFG
jgi:hypothetical protein